MRKSALAMIAVLVAVASPFAQSNARLERALERIERNDANGVRRLITEDPSLVGRTDAGVLPHWQWTLLHVATAHDTSLEVVAALIDAGAAINAQDNEGNTPLHFALKRIGREKLPAQVYDGIIRLLLEKKADIHSANRCGQTPLHSASAFRADPPAVELLIQAGANPNLKTLANCDAWTPLHGATARNSAGIVAVLLKHGADPAARDGRGLTALQVAERGGFADAAKILRAATPAPAPTVAAAPATVAAPPAATAAGVIQGRVLWNGQPVAGATAYVVDNPPGLNRYGTATSDDQGRFSITGVPEGNKFVVVSGNPRVFGRPTSTAFLMSASPFTEDFHLCRGFDPISPSNNESVGSRPVLRWDTFPDATRYFVVVLLQGKSVLTRGGGREPQTATSVQTDVDLPPGVYQWRVTAYNAAGQMIGCSFEPRGFVVRPS